MEAALGIAMNWVNAAFTVALSGKDWAIENYKAIFTIGASMVVCLRSIKGNNLASKLYFATSSYAALIAYKCFPEQPECQVFVMLACMGLQTGLSTVGADFRNIVGWFTKKSNSTNDNKSKEAMLQYIHDFNPSIEEFLATFEGSHTVAEIYEVMSTRYVSQSHGRLYYPAGSSNS